MFWKELAHKQGLSKLAGILHQLVGITQIMRFFKLLDLHCKYTESQYLTK